MERQMVCLFMMFNATFNNSSVISWRWVLLVEETERRPGENHRPVASHWKTLSHNVVHLALTEIRTHNISDMYALYIVVCTFYFRHCVFCSSSIYGFWLPLWYLQTLLYYFFFFFFYSGKYQAHTFKQNTSQKHYIK